MEEESINDFVFKTRISEIRKRPKTKYYWQIIRERTEMINRNGKNKRKNKKTKRRCIE